MFPIFNYGVGFNSNFPDPKPIRAARESSESFGKNDEPVMSGNAVAAAVAALATSCAIMFFAFKKGKVDSEIIVKEVKTLTRDGIDTVKDKIHTVKEGFENAAATVKNAVVGDTAPSMGESSRTAEKVVSNNTETIQTVAKSSDSGTTPAKSAVTEPIAATKKVAEPSPAAKPTESPAHVDKSAEPPAPIIEDKALISPDKPAGDAVNPNTDEMRSFVNKGLDPRADEMSEFVKNGLEPKAADATASANKTAQPLASPAGDKTPTPPKGGTPPTSSAPPTPPASSAPPAPPTPQAPPVPQAPPAPPTAGTRAATVEGSGIPFAPTIPVSAAPKPTATASSEAKMPHTYAEYNKEAGAIGNVDELLAKMHEEPFEPATASPKTPHPREVLSEMFRVNPPATPAVAKAKALAPRFHAAPPKVLGKELFGTPIPIVTDAAKALSKINQEANDIYNVAVNLYKAGHKEVAKEQFAKAMEAWKPLLEHDTDGTYLNAFGQCLQGQGRHKEAIEYYEAAVAKNHPKAKLNLAAHLEAGKGFNSNDLKKAIHLYDEAGALDNLKQILRRDDLPAELFAKTKAAINRIESAPEVVIATSGNAAGAQGAAGLN